MSERKCKDCDQPMLPKGAVKKPNEYDHASGCPNAPKIRLTPLQKRVLDAMEHPGVYLSYFMGATWHVAGCGIRKPQFGVTLDWAIPRRTVYALKDAGLIVHGKKMPANGKSQVGFFLAKNADVIHAG